MENVEFRYDIERTEEDKISVPFESVEIFMPLAKAVWEFEKPVKDGFSENARVMILMGLSWPMTIATEIPIQQQLLSFGDFLVRYGDSNRYELIDGEVFDLEATGYHEEVSAFTTTKICAQIDAIGLNWFVLQRGLLRPSNLGMTAFRPDVMVVDRHELAKELLWNDQSILTLGSSIKFVMEVVSSNWQNDYARKVEDYAILA